MTTPISYFKVGQRKTIILITAGVLTIGALGGLAALVAKGDTSDDRTPKASQGVEDEFDPTPVALPGGETEPKPVPTMDMVTIGESVKIPLPKPWKVDVQSETDADLSDGKGTFVYAKVIRSDETDAMALVPRIQTFLWDTSGSYTDVKPTDPKRLDAKGTIISSVAFHYEGVWADQQSSADVFGWVMIALRQDGEVLILNPEHTPPEEWNDRLSSWSPVVDGALRMFAGF